MKDRTELPLKSAQLAAKGGAVLQRRLKIAQDRLAGRMREISERAAKEISNPPATPWAWWQAGTEYAVDFAQRSVLFWDTLRQRGNNYVEHERAGKPPLLNFEFETVLDGRTLARPVNYALVRIVPPAGVTVNDASRPYVIIDPR